jgi:hypothetical protein
MRLCISQHKPVIHKFQTCVLIHQTAEIKFILIYEFKTCAYEYICVYFYSVHGLKPRAHNFQHLNIKMNHIPAKTAALI